MYRSLVFSRPQVSLVARRVPMCQSYSLLNGLAKPQSPKRMTGSSGSLRRFAGRQVLLPSSPLSQQGRAS